MTIKVKRFQNTRGALNFLEGLILRGGDNIIFRGHANDKHRLVNTWQRHTKIPHESWSSDIDHALEKYKVGLEKIGIKLSDHFDRMELLEHGRHHGLPTPCLDFSYSPYVALFFAFNGVMVNRRRSTYSVVYALNLQQLASEISEKAKKRGPNEDSSDEYQEFLFPQGGYFEHGFPENKLMFLPFAGKCNRRMHRQLGALLYDTQNYEQLGLDDLEAYLGGIKEVPINTGSQQEPGEPVLFKIYINHKCVGDVFERLELMNINGGSLYGDSSGVALDVKNAYNYNPRSMFLHDIKAPEIEERKI